jgi:hypothetical protein
MKKFIIAISLCLFCTRLFGTAQIPDILIYNGDTLSLFSCPLAFYPDKSKINPRNLFGSTGCFYTACYRNYVATWKIENNRLYLLQIRNACYPTNQDYVAATLQEGADSLGKEFADLNLLFPYRFENGKVFADWVSTTMISPIGKLLFYIHDGFESIFEKELEFTFNKGLIVNTREYDNSKTRISKFTSDRTLLMPYIENSIDYSNVPYPDKEIRVMVRISGATKDGKVDGATILKGYDQLYDNEALRVVNSIPEWDVIYRHGEIINRFWMIPVRFKPKNK